MSNTGARSIVNALHDTDAEEWVAVFLVGAVECYAERIENVSPATVLEILGFKSVEMATSAIDELSPELRNTMAWQFKHRLEMHCGNLLHMRFPDGTVGVG